MLPSSAAIDESGSPTAIRIREHAPEPRRDTLYDLHHQFEELVEWRDREGTTDKERAAANLAIKKYAEEELPAKLDNCVRYARNQKRIGEARRAEGEQLIAEAAQAEANFEFMQETILNVMQAFGRKKLEGSIATLRYQGNGGLKPLDIAQPDIVPDNFKRVEVRMPLAIWQWLSRQCGDIMGVRVQGEPEFDNALIRAELDNGNGVPGCRLLDRGVQLRGL